MQRSDVFDSPGGHVATMLSRAWRSSPPVLTMDPTIVDAIRPLLLNSGAGALAWWRLRDRAVGYDWAELHAQYLRYAVHAAQYECQVAEAIGVLRAAGLEPLLIKGWAVGRLYPESGLRPSGDIDLYLPHNQRVDAQNALLAAGQYWVDFQHEEIERHGPGFERLYERSESAQLDGLTIRILAPEDQLRFLCLHFIKHGAWRPLWLCDIAATVESLRGSFDWDSCLGVNKRFASWIAYSIVLAKRLLEADLGNAPLRPWEENLPAWLVKSVLKQWNRPYPANLPSFVVQLKSKGARNAITAATQRWPNPIQAIVDAEGYFDRWPPLAFQTRNCVERSLRLLRELSHGKGARTDRN